jgi:hypothetical protein
MWTWSLRVCCQALVVFLALFAGKSASAFRLYPEQAGKFDWHAAHVGVYAGVALCEDSGSSSSSAASSSLTPSSFVVATDDGVIARVWADSGRLVWRQVLEDGMKVDGQSVVCENGRVAVEGGAHVFDANDGQWHSGGQVVGRKNGSQERVCVPGQTSSALCVDVLVATGVDGLSEAELGAYGASSTRPFASALAFENVAVVQFGCGTTIGFDRKTREILWKRREYLAAIDHVLFTDLPPSTPALEEEWSRSQPSMSRALFVQLLILKTQLGMGTPRDHRVIESYKAMTSNLLRPTRDMDGFRQQIVVTSARAGMVAALHSGDGRVLWEADIAEVGALETLVVAPWSVSVTETETLLVALGRAVSGVDRGVRASVIDGFTGKIMMDDVVVGDNLTVVPVGTYERETRTQHAFAVVVDDAGPNYTSNVVAMLPKEASGEASVVKSLESIVQWKVTEDMRSLVGIKMGVGELWRVGISGTSSPKKEILEVVGRDTDEAMYSVAKPIYGGGILVKSVNPNAVLVIAGDGENLGVTLIDSATGRVIVSQEILHARGPVKGIVSENWAAVHYWDSDAARWTVSVIDLYHPQPDDLTVTALLAGTYRSSSNASPYGPREDLIVDSATFRVKFAASCLAVSKTAHGTAAKMLLLGTPAGQIAAIDRRMLDPRRPKVMPGTKPTPEQAFERLPAFHPEIPVAGTSFVTLSHRVERLRKIHANPAVLESSSLVFAHGLDTYFMRMMPSRGFDTVPPDFPRALLVTMVLGLALGLGLLRRIVRHRTVNLTWK